MLISMSKFKLNPALFREAFGCCVVEMVDNTLNIAEELTDEQISGLQVSSVFNGEEWLSCDEVRYT